ncbi:MAG: hypothetical protein EON57_10115, partial [Alphaproteobacteria bacterium]
MTVRQILALFAGLLMVLGAQPASAQVTVLDEAQDAQPASDPGAPPPPCGTQPITIARMSWPSAELLAEIHARILRQAIDCTVQVTPGDLGATASPV